MEHTRPVGLDKVKAAACEPTPTVVHIGAERGVVGVTARELIAVVVYNGVYPNELAVLVHHLDKFRRCNLGGVLGEYDLGTDVIDI